MPSPTKLLIPIALLLLSFTIGCGRDRTLKIGRSTDEMIETLIIGPYTQTCQGFIEQQCYLEFNEESQEWEFFYESIQGFDFEPGYIYKLKVRLEDRGTEIQDVGRYAYHLVEVLSKEAAPVDERPPENCSICPPTSHELLANPTEHPRCLIQRSSNPHRQCSVDSSVRRSPMDLRGNS